MWEVALFKGLLHQTLAAGEVVWLVVDLDRALLLILNYPLHPLLCCGVVSPGLSPGCRVPGITQVAKSTCRIPSMGPHRPMVWALGWACQ